MKEQAPACLHSAILLCKAERALLIRNKPPASAPGIRGGLGSIHPDTTPLGCLIAGKEVCKHEVVRKNCLPRNARAEGKESSLQQCSEVR